MSAFKTEKMSAPTKNNNEYRREEKEKFKYKEETKKEKYNNTAFSMLFLLYHYRNQLSHEKNIEQKYHGEKLYSKALQNFDTAQL
jgi:hypothetical protein